MAPRLSIIPGRFVEDPRADLNHYKVINALGRLTDADGWCRVRQAVIGGQVGLSRETVNRRMRDLVEWGYVEKFDADASGRSIFYRVLLDSPARPIPSIPADDDDDGADAGKPPAMNPGKPVDNPRPVTAASQVQKYTCDHSDHTRCDAQTITPGVTTPVTHNDPSQRPFSTTPPPYPPALAATAGGEGCGKLGEGQGDKLGASGGQPRLTKFWRSAADDIRALSADEATAAVMADLVLPLIDQPLRPPHDGDPAAYLGQLTALLAGVPREVLLPLREKIASIQARDFPPLAKVRDWLAPLLLAHDNAARNAAAVDACGLPPMADAERVAVAALRERFAALASPVAARELLANVRLVAGPRVATLVVANGALRIAITKNRLEPMVAAVCTALRATVDVEVVAADEMAARIRSRGAAA